MKYIVEMFSVILMLALQLLLCISLLDVSAQVAGANAYKAAVVAEIENSNFNPNVIASCIEVAQKSGYELTIDTCKYEEKYEKTMAQVKLKYRYQIPLIGVSRNRTIYGIAR